MSDPVTTTDYAGNIDIAVTILLDLLKVGAMANPEVAAAAPFISMFINYEAHKIKGGLADGTIVADGKGGLVPITNSRYNAKTGEFL